MYTVDWGKQHFLSKGQGMGDGTQPSLEENRRPCTCSVVISGSTLLTVYLFVVFFYLAAFKRHYALRLAIAPEFFNCTYMCLFYICSGLLK